MSKVVTASIPPHSITANAISVLLDGRMRVISSSSPNFAALKEALRARPVVLKLVKELSNIPAFLAKVTVGRVQVSDDTVLYDGKEIHEYVTTRILNHFRDGDAVEPICRLLEKVMLNPNNSVRNDLFIWLEKANLPICEDGDVIAFKAVNKDYSSGHKTTDGKEVFNTIGSTVAMPRSECDPDRHSTCSTGLHFCSYGYLDQYDGGKHRVIIVKISPTNVTAIPSDSNDQKGRCCEYFVIGEVPFDEAKDALHGNVVHAFGEYKAEEKAEEVATALPQKEASSEEPVFYCGQIDEHYTVAEVLEAAKLGPTKGAVSLGVPRSTFSGWVKRANDWQPLASEVVENADDETPEVADETDDYENDNRDWGDYADDYDESNEPDVPVEPFKASDGSTYTPEVIEQVVREHGQRGASVELGIPRSTLWGWIKKIRG